jgi:hypothetical protein
VDSGTPVSSTSRSADGIASELLTLQMFRVTNWVCSDFQFPCTFGSASTERPVCPESKAVTGSLESNAYGSLHSLPNGPTGNAATKFAELCWTLGDLSSAFACRASTEARSMIYVAALLQLYRFNSAIIG